MPLWTIGVGSGFGKLNGTNFEIGCSDIGIYFQAKHPVKERCLIEVFYTSNMLSNKRDSWTGEKVKNKSILSLGIGYRFGNKTVLR